MKTNVKTEKHKCPLCEGEGHITVEIRPKIDHKKRASIAKKMKGMGFTVRQIAAAMGFKHPGSVSHLLNRK